MQVEATELLGIPGGRDSSIDVGYGSSLPLERFATFGPPPPPLPGKDTQGMPAALFGLLVEFQFSEGEAKSLAEEFDAYASGAGLSEGHLASLLLARMSAAKSSEATSGQVPGGSGSMDGAGNPGGPSGRRHQELEVTSQSLARKAFALRGENPMDLKAFIEWNTELSGRVKRRAVAERGVTCTRGERMAAANLCGRMKRRTMDTAPSSLPDDRMRVDCGSQSLDFGCGSPKSPSVWMGSKPGSGSFDELEEGEALVVTKRQRRSSLLSVKKQQPVSPNSASKSCELLKAIYKGPSVSPIVRSLLPHPQKDTSKPSGGPSSPPAAPRVARRNSLFTSVKWRQEAVAGGLGGNKPGGGASPWESQIAAMKQRRKSFSDIVVDTMPNVLKEPRHLLSRIGSTPANDKASFLVSMLRDKMVLA